MSRFNCWSKWVVQGTVVAGMAWGAIGAGQSIAAEPALSPKGEYVPFKEAFKTRQEMNIWKKMFRKTDELLRPPFDKAPPDEVKGLASKIRQEELDVNNRILAVEYLGKVDCVAYPEAPAMLIDVLHNDKWEEVRLAAAVALKNMLTGCCRGQMVEKETTDRDKEGRYDRCPGCCTKEVLNALAKVAYEYDDKGCTFEPSLRVREAAVEAIKACCIPCNYGPYMVPSEVPEVPPVEPETGEIKPMDDGEKKPDADGETPATDTPAGDAPAGDTPAKEAFLLPVPLSKVEAAPDQAPPAQRTVEATPVSTAPAKPASIREATMQQARPMESAATDAAGYPVVDALKGYCVVALKARMFVKAKPELFSVYKGHRYHFWSAAAKAEFDRYPESYAVQFSGADPVELARGNHTQGQYLRDFDDRFYLFSSKENWETFKSSPTAYLPQDSAIPQPEIVRTGAMGRKLGNELSPALATRRETR